MASRTRATEPADYFAGVFTTEELLALAGAFGLQAPWFLKGPIVQQWPPAVLEEIRQIGARSLFARDLVAETESGWATTEPIQRMVKIIAEPLLAVGVARVADGKVTTWSYAARPEGCVSHAITTLGVHQITMFSTMELLPAIIVATGLRRATKPESGEVRISSDQVTNLLAADNAEPLDLGQDALIERGFNAEAAALIDHLGREGHSASFVTSLHPDSDHSVAGAMTTWVDAADNGLWMVEPTSQQSDESASGALPVMLMPADTQTILDSIRSGLPAAGNSATEAGNAD